MKRRSSAVVAVYACAALMGLGGASLAQSTGSPGADSIDVTLDQAKLVKLPAGADTIVIGNPAIADVTLRKNGVMVITGRSTGRTNFVALDASGAIISESMVMVSVPTLGRVVVQRGLDRASYDCAPLCAPVLSLGDEDKHFGRSEDQATRRNRMAGSSADASPARPPLQK